MTMRIRLLFCRRHSSLRTQLITSLKEDMKSPITPSCSREAVQNTIRTRRTLKVLGDVDQPVEISDEICEKNRPIVAQAITDAGWAPFHYARNVDGIPEPWRFHVLWHESCRKIATHFTDWFPDAKPNNKLPLMLSACGALILVNWIPQDELSETAEKSRQINEEHLAATSAAVQNLLLLLTAQEMGTYWSSGGQFRTNEMFSRLGVSERERLLAAVFVEFPEMRNAELERLAGKHRVVRTDSAQWSRVVQL